MQIIFKKSFVKQYAKLGNQRQANVDESLRLFRKNPNDPKLKNHILKGKLAGFRAISAGFDLRIVFKTTTDYIIVELIAVGSHNQVY